MKGKELGAVDLPGADTVREEERLLHHGRRMGVVETVERRMDGLAATRNCPAEIDPATCAQSFGRRQRSARESKRPAFAKVTMPPISIHLTTRRIALHSLHHLLFKFSKIQKSASHCFIMQDVTVTV